MRDGIVTMMQLADQTPMALRIVTSAVTPVVMVSATAILIGSVNTRYIAVSDRIRALSREYRENAAEDRKNIIEGEIGIFLRRIFLLSWAMRLLFLGTGFFISVALLISVSTWNAGLSATTLPIFLVGLSLVASAIVLVFMELRGSHQTIHLEASDILANRQRKMEAKTH